LYVVGVALGERVYLPGDIFRAGFPSFPEKFDQIFYRISLGSGFK